VIGSDGRGGEVGGDRCPVRKVILEKTSWSRKIRHTARPKPEGNRRRKNEGRLKKGAAVGKEKSEAASLTFGEWGGRLMPGGSYN